MKTSAIIVCFSLYSKRSGQAVFLKKKKEKPCSFFIKEMKEETL
jgi:hypothetical protein